MNAHMKGLFERGLWIYFGRIYTSTSHGQNGIYHGEWVIVGEGAGGSLAFSAFGMLKL